MRALQGGVVLSHRTGFSAKAKFGARKLAPEKFLLHTPVNFQGGVSLLIHHITSMSRLTLYKVLYYVCALSLKLS